MKRLAVLLLVSVVLVGMRQRPTTNTEVYVTTLGRDTTTPAGGTAVDISNSPGYDNQPSFTPDGKAILFTSDRGGKQTDIYRYDITTKVVTQLTHTPESEYSPIVTPDGRTFSVIRVEADGTQRLWRFDLDGSNPRLVLENVKGVGYHAWLDATHVAVFIVGANGQPNTLQLADTTTDTARLVDSNPGRGLAIRPVPRSSTVSPTLTYVCKTDPARWVVKEFSVANPTPVVLMDALAGSEDLAWDPADATGPYQRLFMAKGSQLYMSIAGHGWQPAGDFASAGVDHITRLAISPVASATGPRLAFVAEPVAK